MSLILRDIEAEDLDAVWALNNAAGCSIVPIDRERMRRAMTWLKDRAGD